VEAAKLDYFPKAQGNRRVSSRFRKSKKLRQSGVFFKRFDGRFGKNGAEG
jgi:hypothetical protein